MNRFDDKWTWQLLEKVGIPVGIALLTAAVIWGSMKEKITSLERINAADRLARLETEYADMATNIVYIRNDVKELLRLTARKSRE